jgi:hypothetical protein
MFKFGFRPHVHAKSACHLISIPTHRGSGGVPNPAPRPTARSRKPPPATKLGSQVRLRHSLPLYLSKTKSKSSSRPGQICYARCGEGRRRLAGRRACWSWAESRPELATGRGGGNSLVGGVGNDGHGNERKKRGR